MKTVMITGTSSGFGLKCVELFHARGCQFVATRRKLADGNPFWDVIYEALIKA